MLTYELDIVKAELERMRAERDRLGDQVEEFRECFGNLARERDELWNDLERVTMERDQARSTAAYLWARSSGGDEATALREFYASKGWSLPQEKGHE